MKPVEVLLSFGSNLGDRESNIKRAISMIADGLSCNATEISPIIETEAEGFEGPDFLDCVAVFKTVLSPQELLSLCKETEKILGRTDKPEYNSDGTRIYHDRPIDIDILFYSDLRIDTPFLTIPHPQVKNRGYIKELLLSLTSQKDRMI